jgi:hypothetical protein
MLQQAVLAPLPQMRHEQSHAVAQAPVLEWPLVWKEAQKLVTSLRQISAPSKKPEDEAGIDTAAVSNDSSPPPQQPDLLVERSGLEAEPISIAKV